MCCSSIQQRNLLVVCFSHIRKELLLLLSCFQNYSRYFKIDGRQLSDWIFNSCVYDEGRRLLLHQNHRLWRLLVFSIQHVMMITPPVMQKNPKQKIESYTHHNDEQYV